MIVARSIKCHFNSWLTNSKKRQLKRLSSEYNRVVTEAILLFEADILSGMGKKDLLLAVKLYKIDSWLTQRAKKNAYAEAYALVKGASESAKALGKKYKTPKHSKQMMLSETNVKINLEPGTRDFDIMVELYSMDGLKTKKLALPLKRSRHFNIFYLHCGWKLSKSVTIHENYVQFTFTKDVKKKEFGDILGVDPGATNLLTTSDGEFFGTGIRKLLDKQSRKRRGSVAWWAARNHIQQYIDKACKSLPYKKLELLVLEDNRRIKHKSKLKGRLSKNMRSVLSGWAIGRINNRIEMLCETNGVRLRRARPFNNSCTCPDCGFTDKRNRRSQDEFVCVDCGSIHHADIVGGMNSLGGYCLGPYGAEYQQRFRLKHPTYFECLVLHKLR